MKTKTIENQKKKFKEIYGRYPSEKELAQYYKEELYSGLNSRIKRTVKIYE